MKFIVFLKFSKKKIVVVNWKLRLEALKQENAARTRKKNSTLVNYNQARCLTLFFRGPAKAHISEHQGRELRGWNGWMDGNHSPPLDFPQIQVC